MTESSEQEAKLFSAFLKLIEGKRDSECPLQRRLLQQAEKVTAQLPAAKAQAQLQQWLAQRYDPFPNMSRHRVLYILEGKLDNLTLSLFKGYVRPDGSYFSKTPLPLNSINNKKLPTFISLSDQWLMQQLSKRTKQLDSNQLPLDKEQDGQLLQHIIGLGRCFWQQPDNGPLLKTVVAKETVTQTQSKVEHLSDNLWLSSQHNCVYQIENAQTLAKESIQLQPSMVIDTVQPDWPWLSSPIQIDVLRVSFSGTAQTIETESALALGNQQVLDSLNQLQLFNPVSQSTDWALAAEGSAADCLLSLPLERELSKILWLQQQGWQVNVAPSFRLQQQQVENWYIEAESGANQQVQFRLGILHDQQKVEVQDHIRRALKNTSSLTEALTVTLSDGTVVQLAAEQIQQVVHQLADVFAADNKQLQIPSNQAYRLAQLQQQFNGTLDWFAADELKDKAQALANSQGVQPVSLPQGLNARLRDYQQRGFDWLQLLAQHHLGGILADDMGLGKTLQVLTHLLAQHSQDELNPSLVVAPKTLLHNWQRESQQYTPQLKVLIVHGSNREALYSQVSQVDLVITSYGTLQRDSFLQRQPYQCVVLDEAQTIKNAASQVTQRLKRLTAQQRLCLTGTPMENHLGELWSLFDFVMPGLLGSQAQFNRHYRQPIEQANDQERQQSLKLRMAPFMLRRTKQQVATELPEKTEMVELLDLNPDQQQLYSTTQMALVKQIQNSYQESQGQALRVGNALLKLRQICCHPQLIGQDELTSAKLDWLMNALPEMVTEGRRVLVFSSFTTMLERIGASLIDLGMNYLTLTGKTRNRQAVVEQFQQESCPIFLISLKAGGAGLNLTAADTVIHVDPWWNPAAEAQASDRAHRIGQTKRVFVYKLISRNTIEHQILKLQQQKSQLANQLIQQSEIQVNQISGKDWLRLLQTGI